MITYRHIFWNNSTGKFVAIADPNISISTVSNPDPYSLKYIVERRVFVVIEGNTIKKTYDAMNVKLTDSGIEKLFTNLILGKRRFKEFKEDQIRQWHPEFNIAELDELVEKRCLFERIKL